ncbi:Hypothetical protein NTJ_01473 [Nesidiocoris tenuis]|uniref:Uncharacterized protein n=1 Tax=Nesidiocoris tenuis TaxID=355587 RepID=A0ABN7ACV6_9HEMI|nr:Hypothetical protein NTJ_01473 [Nesidiocoris tenuis]
MIQGLRISLALEAIREIAVVVATNATILDLPPFNGSYPKLFVVNGELNKRSTLGVYVTSDQRIIATSPDATTDRIPPPH